MAALEKTGDWSRQSPTGSSDKEYLITYQAKKPCDEFDLMYQNKKQNCTTHSIFIDYYLLQDYYCLFIKFVGKLLMTS